MDQRRASAISMFSSGAILTPFASDQVGALANSSRDMSRALIYEPRIPTTSMGTPMRRPPQPKIQP